MNLKEMRAEALGNAQAVVAGIKAIRGADATLSEDESAKVKSYMDEVKALDVKIAAATADEAMLTELGSLDSKSDEGTKPVVEVKHEDVHVLQAKVTERPTLGEHFIKSGAHKRMVEAHDGGSVFSVAAPELEIKAAGDLTTSRGDLSGIYPQPAIGPFVQSFLRRPVVSDLLGTGNLGQSTTLKYYIQDELASGTAASASGGGAFATVPEGGLKPQLNFAAHAATESLYKIAGYYKISDEMLEDEAYFVSIINGQLLQRLALVEEQKLLYGNGSSDIDGLLHRTSVLTNGNQIALAASATAGSGGVLVADAVFQAVTNILLSTGLAADGVIMNPADYLKLRLLRDANGQYYGGGYFQGEYGNGGNQLTPNPWGLRIVQTPAINPGQILVADFQDLAQVYRKGGIRVDSTNTDQDDFIHNMVKVRAEERLLLAVPRPLAASVITIA